MIDARPTLEYRAAVDDRRQRFERMIRFIPKIVLVVMVVLCAYVFLLGVLGGIILTVASLVSANPRIGLAAAASFGASTLGFLLMLFCAKAIR